MELETVTEKQGGGRPSRADIPFSTAWLAHKYGLSTKQAQRNRFALLRIPMMKPEARRFTLHSIGARLEEE